VFSHLSIQELLSKLEELGDQVPMELVQAILTKESEAMIPLRDILQDDNYWEAEDNRQLMPLHAVKLLGMLADPRALPQLVNALIQACKVYDYSIMKDLPTVFGRIGPSAIPLLEEFIHVNKGDNEFWYIILMSKNVYSHFCMSCFQKRMTRNSWDLLQSLF